MLYLVDLDDSPGYTLTFDDDDYDYDIEEGDEPDESTPLNKSKPSVAAETKAILKEAQAKLDAIAARAGI